MISLTYGSHKEQLPENVPKYIDLEFSFEMNSTSSLVFDFLNPDSLITHQMNLIRDSENLAFAYYSDIQTPVCIDGICKPLRIEMYWSLLGTYIGYGVFPRELLSKYDHDLFQEADYLKLHKLLKDQHSILDRKDMTSLYDIDQSRKDTITFNGIAVDGVTGATKKEIKNSIVEGALYSCFKLWHIANGEASRKAKLNISHIYSDNLENTFLRSKRSEYQLFALQQLDSISMIQKINNVIPLIAKGDPLQRSYILKKIPVSLFKDSTFVKEVYKSIDGLDINSRTILIIRLVVSNSIAFEMLAKQLQVLSKNQVKMYLKILKENQQFLNDEVLQNLEVSEKSPEFAYGYLVEKFLGAR